MMADYALPKKTFEREEVIPEPESITFESGIHNRCAFVV